MRQPGEMTKHLFRKFLGYFLLSISLAVVALGLGPITIMGAFFTKEKGLGGVISLIEARSMPHVAVSSQLGPHGMTMLFPSLPSRTSITIRYFLAWTIAALMIYLGIRLVKGMHLKKPVLIAAAVWTAKYLFLAAGVLLSIGQVYGLIRGLFTHPGGSEGLFNYLQEVYTRSDQYSINEQGMHIQWPTRGQVWRGYFTAWAVTLGCFGVYVMLRKIGRKWEKLVIPSDTTPEAGPGDRQNSES